MSDFHHIQIHIIENQIREIMKTLESLKDYHDKYIGWIPLYQYHDAINHSFQRGKRESNNELSFISFLLFKLLMEKKIC